MTTIAVCGGRDFGCFMKDDKLVVVKPERDFICDVLLACAGFDNAGEPNPVTIMHGACPTGVDRVADAWAKRNMMVVDRNPADWDRHGKKAGPLRNQKMVDKQPTFCIAFPGGRGTADMAARCEDAGIMVLYPIW